MVTQTHSKPLIYPTGKSKVDRQDQTSSTSFVQAKKSKILFTLTVLIWIVAPLVAIAFYFAVRNNLAEADWLAGILLGMVVLGWIMFAMYYHAAGKLDQTDMERYRHDLHNPAQIATTARAAPRKDRFV